MELHVVRCEEDYITRDESGQAAAVWHLLAAFSLTDVIILLSSTQLKVSVDKLLIQYKNCRSFDE